MRDDPRSFGTNPDDYDYATNKASASDYILREARDAGVRLVRCLWADISNVIRGRSIHVGALRNYMINGIGLPASTMGLTMTDVQAAPSLHGQVRLLPDADTFRVVQYAPNTALMLGDLYETDLQPWALCPRSFLKRVVADLTDLGLRAQVGFEIEFFFGVRGSEGSFVPVDESLYSSSVGMAVAAKVINDIVGSLDDQRIPLDHYHPELGHGQQEIALAPSDPLTACDRVLRLRETVRSIAWSHGWYASFAARPFEAQPPSGMHAHLSLWNRYDQNLMFEPAQDNNRDISTKKMGDQAAWLMSGVLRHMPGLTALACPTVNSYRRLQMQSSLPPFAAWGYDNRQTMLRVVPLTWHESALSANIELKLPDGSANPYLMIGGMLAAGLDGIANHYRLPTPVEESPGALDADIRQKMGIQALPASLTEACDLLEQDAALTAALGAPMIDAFLAVKRQEVKTFEGASLAVEIARHFWKF